MTTLWQRIPRNAILLGFILVLIVASPSASERFSGKIFELLFDGVLLSGVYSAGAGRHRWPYLILTAIALSVRWGEHLAGIPQLDVSALVITVAWLLYTIALIVGSLFRRRDVTVDTILAAVSVYFLIAITFTLTFEVLELVNPGSFSGLPVSAATNRRDLAAALMYYSLVCLSTMGFGDITPVSELARPISALEGVVGQLYLAVLIARLVGLHISGAGNNSDE